MEETRKTQPTATSNPNNTSYYDNFTYMQSLASSLSNIHNNSNTSSQGVYKTGGLPIGAFDTSATNTMNFFQQQAAGSSRASETDIGAMDDVQFSASLDALLNGDQTMAGLGAPALNNNTSTGSSVSGLTGGGLPSLPGNNNNVAAAPGNTQQHQQQQQQPAMGNMQQYYVSAPAGGAVTHHQQQQQQPPQQQQQQQHFTISPAAASQLAGLPLASANQGGLQLVPAGAHNAAQMSLSAGHAAATGAFHPANAAPNGQMLPAAPFPWAMNMSNMNNNNNVASSVNESTGGGGMSVATSTVAAPVSSMTSATTMSGNNNTNTSNSKSSGTVSSSRGTKRQLSSNRSVSVCPVSEDEGDREKRKRERNLREQQRSHKITEQIAELKEVLSSANQQFKPDKYSTLTKVAEYIKELQDRSKFLDGEHKKLLETITETNEIVNCQYVPAYTSGSDTPSVSNDLLAGDASSSSLEDESRVYVRGIDYKIAFKGCGIPLALASIDGRFLDCNDTFLELTGYSREELLPLEQSGKQNTVRFSPDQDDSHKKNLSLFNLLSRDGMEQVFMAMSEMLKQPGSIGTTSAMPTEASRIADFWSGPVKLGRQDDLPVKLNVTLVRTSRRRPKFFNCALTALDGEDDFRFDDQTTLTTPSQTASDGTKETNSTSNNDQPQTTDVAPTSVPSTTNPVPGQSMETAQQVVPPVENEGGQSGA